MNFSDHSVRTICFLACMALGSPGAWAGGDMGEMDDHHDDDGPSFFGFVKDAGGKPIDDAKVTINVKNGITLVTRTTKAGVFKFGNFKKTVDPKDVTISCSRDGYKQTRVTRRVPPGDKPNKAIETECRMQAG